MKRKCPKKRSPVKRKSTVKWKQVPRTWQMQTSVPVGLVTAVAINEEINKMSDALEDNDRGMQDESMSELKKEMEKLKNKLQEEKEKRNALVIQRN